MSFSEKIKTKLQERKKRVAEEKAVNKLNAISPVTNAIFHIILLLVALICFLPFVSVVIISLTKEAILQKGYQLWPSEWSLKGYTFYLAKSNVIVSAAKMSVIVTVIGTFLGVILTTLMGYVISRRSYKGQSFFTWVVFIPMIFNGGFISSYVVNVNLLGLKNNIGALIFPLLVSSFNVIISKTFFRQTIPDSIIESAKMDGASQWTIFGRIVIPISKPVFATIGLFLSFGYWNDWFQNLMYITDQKLFTLQGMLQKMLNDTQWLVSNVQNLGLSAIEILKQVPQESSQMAVAVIAIIPIALAYPFFQRYFVSGLTIGAVKG